MKYILLIFLINIFWVHSQEDIYISKNSNLVTFSNSQIAIFGNLINDTKGGFSHINYYKNNQFQDAGTVYLIRTNENGVGISRIYGGPEAIIGADSLNSDGSYCRFWNFITDNNTDKSEPSNTLINEDYGYGNINIEQEVKVNNSHHFVNGIVWTPRNRWKNTFINYENLLSTDSIKLIGVSDSSHVDGYVVESGFKKSFIYPIGDGNKLRSCGIIKKSNHSTKAAYFNQNPISKAGGISGILPSENDTNNLEENLVKVSNTEFWDIDALGEIEVYLSPNNFIDKYSNWYNRFSNSENIIIAGFDGKWQDLSFNFSKLNNQDSLIRSNKFNSTNDFSLFTWAEIDTTVMSMESINLNENIKVVYSNSEIARFSFSFGYDCNSEINVYDLLGNNLFSKNLFATSDMNYFDLSIKNLNEIYFIIIKSNRNQYLFYKFIHSK